MNTELKMKNAEAGKLRTRIEDQRYHNEFIGTVNRKAKEVAKRYNSGDLQRLWFEGSDMLQPYL